MSPLLGNAAPGTESVIVNTRPTFTASFTLADVPVFP